MYTINTPTGYGFVKLSSQKDEIFFHQTVLESEDGVEIDAEVVLRAGAEVSVKIEATKVVLKSDDNDLMKEQDLERDREETRVGREMNLIRPDIIIPESFLSATQRLCEIGHRMARSRRIIRHHVYPVIQHLNRHAALYPAFLAHPIEISSSRSITMQPEQGATTVFVCLVDFYHNIIRYNSFLCKFSLPVQTSQCIYCNIFEISFCLIFFTWYLIKYACFVARIGISHWTNCLLSGFICFVAFC